MYKVLVVEPQEFSLNALLNLPVWDKDTDAHQGFHCAATAGNGQEAYELIKANSFDLILTEINLTICDGLQLLKQIHKSNQPPLVVFISDIVTFAYARESFIYGAFDYLPKPVSQHDIAQLFARAAEELERLKKQHLSMNSSGNFRFAPGQIAKVLDDFAHRNRNVLQTFHNMLHSLYDSPGKTGQNPDLLASKLYLSLVEGIYAHNEWISLYIPRNFHEQIDYLELQNPSDYIDFYQRKFTYLFERYCGLNPEFEDATIVKIHLYLLGHPEEDLRLTTIAGKFYLNHTYLSNLFSRKSSLRYSQLVTMVKMHRAEYLINYTTLPLEDIASCLGYKDFRYFLKLFKETIGKAASDYIREEEYYSDYSI
ncbi:MAG: response regulator [Lachnospiraceae bacterium]|nr:response regulator [Lachnospiraceae bacterium]